MASCTYAISQTITPESVHNRSRLLGRSVIRCRFDDEEWIPVDAAQHCALGVAGVNQLRRPLVSGVRRVVDEHAQLIDRSANVLLTAATSASLAPGRRGTVHHARLPTSMPQGAGRRPLLGNGVYPIAHTSTEPPEWAM
jgi:hypothetical protein